MKQATFASLSFTAKKKRARREVFLAEMDRVVPWTALEALIEQHYPTSGRPPMALSTMLRIHFLRQWYALSDPAMEDALYEIESMRRFAGIELNEEAIPDETTILKFRRLLERYALAPTILEAVNTYLEGEGLLLRRGMIVDATIIAVPSSTKNRDQARDPAMHQTRKGNQWYFGMKAHIGVDCDSGLVHTVRAAAANATDVTEVGAMLHGGESVAYGDFGDTGANKRPRGAHRKIAWRIAEKRGAGADAVRAVEPVEGAATVNGDDRVGAPGRLQKAGKRVKHHRKSTGFRFRARSVVARIEKPVSSRFRGGM